jgi:hypothetical protein
VTPNSIDANPRSLGMLWFLYGVLRAASAAFLFVFSGTFTLMAGALLTRVPDALAWMSAFHFLFWLLIAWCIACAILSFFAGAALLSGGGSARRIAVLASFVCLPELPLGVILGVYTLLRFWPRSVESSR